MMEDTLVLEKSEILVSERTRLVTEKNNKDRAVTKHNTRRTITDLSPYNLMTEGGESFMTYVNYIKTNKNENVLVLSSKYHFYYDLDEIKGVTTLINLKRLNFMNHLESFLHVVGNILSPGARFIGCFADKKTQRGVGMSSRMYKKLLNFLDYRIDIEIDKRYLIRLFESCGFSVLDMTEINGITYFTTSKFRN